MTIGRPVSCIMISRSTSGPGADATRVFADFLITAPQNVAGQPQALPRWPDDCIEKGHG
jgi:hypothetical protein